MLWNQWLQAFGVLLLIFTVAMVFGLIIWRLAKKDEEDRRLREEGPNHQGTSRYSGTMH